VDVHVTTIKP